MKKIKWAFICVLLVSQLLISGCGGAANSENKAAYTVGAEQSEASEVTMISAEEQKEEIKNNREVITLGGSAFLKILQKTVDAFNNAQDKYWLELVQYDSTTAIMLDITRKEGADIFYMELLDLNLLAEKGVVEDLTPYFEKSEVVKKEDLISSVWRAGSIGERMYYVVPRFEPGIYVVEKGYTDNGIWTVDDYFELGEKYPEGRISEYITEPKTMVLNDIKLVFDEYVDWETRSSKFDSEEFVELLEKIKYYGEKEYASIKGYTVAEQLQQKLVQSKIVYLSWFPYMTEYKDLRDSLLGFCEIAGMPNNEGKLKYIMDYREIYAINAGSERKEAAWAFMEFILSKEYQASLSGFFFGGDGKFPARRDVLEESLDEEINLELEIIYLYNDMYTGEKKKGVSDFTEEDKQLIIDILENCYGAKTIMTQNILGIVNEEIGYYLGGAKSAEEVARIIHNRVSLYLME